MKILILLSVIYLIYADGVCPAFKCAEIDAPACVGIDTVQQAVVVKECDKGLTCMLPGDSLVDPNGPMTIYNTLLQNTTSTIDC